MSRGRELLVRLRRGGGTAWSAPRNPGVTAPEPAAPPALEAASATPLRDVHKIVELLESLSLKKQVNLCELWAGPQLIVDDGLTVTVRSTKERRRFSRSIDEHVLSWFSRFQSGDVFYDIGANCGGLTLKAGAMHRDRIQIVAIEPGFASFDSLARNLSQNTMLGFVVPLQVALLDRTGLQPLHYNLSTSAGTAVHAVGQPVDQDGNTFTPVETQTVASYALDDLIEALELPQPTVMKIDVDGYEGPVLHGARRTLERGVIRELLLEVIDHDDAGTRLESVQSLLAGCGYELSQTFRHHSSAVADHLFALRDAGAVRDRMPTQQVAEAATVTNGAARGPDAPRASATAADDERAGQKAQAKAAAAAERAAQKAQAKAAAAAERAAQKAQAKAAAAAERAARKGTPGAGFPKRRATQEEKAAAAKARLQRRAQATADRARMLAELEELRSSYHLSGAAKKLDLRQLEPFSTIADGVMTSGRTGMNYDRLYTLWQAVRTAPPDAPIAEVGAYLGGSARFIVEALRTQGRAPRFYVCDTFAGHAHTDPDIDVLHHDSRKFAAASASAAAEYLSGCPGLELVVGDIVETSERLAHETFGFVHVDVDVYPTTDFCLRFFAPRLAEGGVIVIDDYGFVTCPGVKRAADEFVAEFPQFRLWHLLTGQATIARGTAAGG